MKSITRALSLALGAALGTTLAASGLAGAPAAAATPLPPTELVGQFAFVPLPQQARIVVSDHGLRFVAGQQHSHLRVTEVGGKLRFVDTGTARWRDLAPGCTPIKVAKGVGADCTVPSRWSGGKTMFVEIWPRLGNDVVDTSALGARFRSWVLVDAGADRVRTGAGDDFVNAAFGRDVVDAGAGDDWVRGGSEADVLVGGRGDDKLVGQQGRDVLRGGEGDDALYGMTQSDRLRGGPGADVVSGGPGRDLAWHDGRDRLREVEVRRRS